MMKKGLNDLALFGGPPAFHDKLHVGRPNIGNRERLLQRINELLDRRWLTNNGPCVQEFEQQLAQMLGVKHCVAMCNGTIALEIVIRALGLTGEVIVPSFTFVATAHALQWQEITPVFCDIDPATHTLDPARIEALITPRTTGIIGVHLWGRACKVGELERLAEKHRLKLVFDAAHAFACSHNGRMIGGFGAAEVFSFHATKFFNAFEGGAVVTNDAALADKLRLMKNFGFAGYDNVVHVGTNGKLTEVCAVMGLTGLESLPEVVAANRRNYLAYQAALRNLPGVGMVQYDEKEQNNYQYIVLEIDQAVTQVSRDNVLKALQAENVVARRYFYPGCHRMEPYRSYFPNARLLLPQTERLAQRVLVLPTGQTLGAAEIETIAEIIRVTLAHGAQIEKAMAQRT